MQIMDEDPTRMRTVCGLSTLIGVLAHRESQLKSLPRRVEAAALLATWQDMLTVTVVVLDVQWMIDRMTELLCRRSIDAKYDASAYKKDAWTELRSRGRFSIDLRDPSPRKHRAKQRGAGACVAA